MTASTTTIRRKCDSADPWCIPTLTSNSSDNSESALTLVFAPSYTHHRSNQNICYFFLPHCPFQHFPQYSVKSFLLVHKAHIQLFSFSMILFLHPSQDKHSINFSSLRHKAKLHFIGRHYSTRSIFHHIHSMLRNLHSSMAATISDVTLPLEDWNLYA